jgi:uncharacterized membrane protein
MAKKATILQGPLLSYVLLIGGFIGMLASFILTAERFALLKDPTYVASCNLNPLFSCVSVSSTPQAETFGFPNMLFGIVGFSMVMTVGAALLAGARFRNWFWQLLNVGALGGIIFVHWLFIQSVYSIGALCIYCMIVWAVTAPIFWYTTVYNIREGSIPWLRRFSSLPGFLQRHHGLILAAWYFGLLALILQRFWGSF